MITIVTAVTNGYDDLISQPEQDVPCEWIAYTDDPNATVPYPWGLRPLPAYAGHPRMAAKVPKCTPRAVLPGCERTIWIDANTQITSPAFAREAMACVRDTIAVFEHPQRACVYDEAGASWQLCPEKYDRASIERQVESYRREGFPGGAGLYACGTVARDLTGVDHDALGEAWLAECEAHTYQDQLSLPVVAWRLGAHVGTFPHRQITRRRLSNPWQTLHPHLRSD